MKTLAKFVSATILFGTALFSSSTMAQANSSAGISDTSYQLIDLDATDGIAPTITFFSTNGSSTARVLTGTYSDGYSSSATRNSTSSRAIGVSVGDEVAGASANYSGGTFGSLYTSGQINDVGNYSAAQSFSTGFTLAPKTLLVVFGHMSGKAVGGMYWDQNASSSADISLSGYLTPYGGYQSSQVSASAYTYYGGASQFDREFGLSFINGTSTELSGNFRVSTSVDGVNNIAAAAPVPEPETWAMLLGGLALLGAIARRRKQERLM